MQRRSSVRDLQRLELRVRVPPTELADIHARIAHASCAIRALDQKARDEHGDRETDDEREAGVDVVEERPTHRRGDEEQRAEPQRRVRLARSYVEPPRSTRSSSSFARVRASARGASSASRRSRRRPPTRGHHGIRPSSPRYVMDRFEVKLVTASRNAVTSLTSAMSRSGVMPAAVKSRT